MTRLSVWWTVMGYGVVLLALALWTPPVCTVGWLIVGARLVVGAIPWSTEHEDDDDTGHTT